MKRSGKHIPQRILSREGRRYYGEEPYWNGVGTNAVRQQLPEGWTPIMDRVMVEIICRPPSRHRRDLNAGTKAILDTIERAGVIRDDIQIRPIFIDVGPLCKNGIVWVRLTQLEIRDWEIVPDKFRSYDYGSALVSNPEDSHVFHRGEESHPDGKEQDPWEGHVEEDRSGQLDLFASHIATRKDPRP